MIDKITYAGLIQQDATLDMLKSNKLVRSETKSNASLDAGTTQPSTVHLKIQTAKIV